MKGCFILEEKKTFFGEFKEFISKGSVLDLAVGVIVGGAFTAIVNSLVNDVIMPLVGLLLAGVDFTALKITLKAAADDGTGGVFLAYGNFLQATVNFLLVAFVLFLVIKGINSLRRKEDEKEEAPEEPPKPSEEVLLLREIRDSLKK